MPHEANRRLRIGDTTKRKFAARNKSDRGKDQERIPANPQEAATAQNYQHLINQRRNANAAATQADTPTKVKQPRRPISRTPGIPSPDGTPPSPVRRRQAPESSSTAQSPSRAPQTASSSPQTAKAPASGTMSHTPANATQRGSVSTGGDTRSQQIISGTEAVNRAGDEAARRKMERLLWGIGVGGGN